jgi:hypothetical protein
MKNWKALPRETRRDIMRQAVQAHDEHRKLYRTVTRGF